MFNWNETGRDANGKVVLLYRHQRILDEGVVSSGDKVLDVGGWGTLAIALIEEGADCTILDNFSDDQYFPDRVLGLPHISGDILDSKSLEKWGAGSFDVVTTFEMLEHCEDQEKALLNMYSMLKPEGRIAGTVPIPGHAHAHDDDVTFIDEDRLLSLLVSSGFTDILIEPTGSVTKDETPCSLFFKAKK